MENHGCSLKLRKMDVPSNLQKYCPELSESETVLHYSLKESKDQEFPGKP